MDVHRMHLKLCFYDADVLRPPSHMFLLTEKDEQDLNEQAGMPATSSSQAASSSSRAVDATDDWVQVDEVLHGGHKAEGPGGADCDNQSMAHPDYDQLNDLHRLGFLHPSPSDLHFSTRTLPGGDLAGQVVSDCA